MDKCNSKNEAAVSEVLASEGCIVKIYIIYVKTSSKYLHVW